MMRYVKKVLFLIALTLSAGVAHSDAKLVGLDSKKRIPGSFFVVFKGGSDLTMIPVDGQGAPAVLPKVQPISRDSASILATALCATISARLTGVTFFDSGYAAFTVSDGSDEAVRSMLAKDPRIAEIDATFTVIDDEKALGRHAH
jgi:hypothetical protein